MRSEEPEEQAIPTELVQIPGRTIPEGITVAPGIEMDSDDPAAVQGGRQCVALSRAGERCRTRPATSLVLCNAHAGLLDPRKGGLALAEKKRQNAEAVEERRVEAALGTRAVVAAALREKHEEIRLAIANLADAAAAGDRQSALALIPWLNQGMGMPVQAQTVEVGAAEGEGEVDLKALNTAQLLALRASMRTTTHPTEVDTQAS